MDWALLVYIIAHFLHDCYIYVQYILESVLGFSTVNRHHDHDNSYKEQHLIGAGLQVRRFSSLSSRREHGTVQAGVVQEELRVLCLHLRAANERWTSGLG